MITRTMMLLAAALAMAAIVVGCGDDDESSAPASASGGPALTTSSLGKAQYVKRASAACEKKRENILAELAAYEQKHPTRENPRAERRLFAGIVGEVMVPKFEAELAAVRSLGAPEGDEEELEGILAAQEAAIEEVKKLTSPKSYDEIEAPFASAARQLKDYGFTSCYNSE